MRLTGPQTLDPQTPDPTPNATAFPETLWLLAQAGVIAAYATGVRPTSGYPLPVADSADLGMAVVQLTLASLFGPGVLATPGRWLRTAATAVAFFALAAALAGRAAGTAVSTGVVLVAWLLGLAALTRTRPGSLVAVGLTIGLPVLWYVRIEYAGRPATLNGWPAIFGPVLGICATRLHGSPWPALIGPFALAAAAFAFDFRSKIGRRLRSLPVQ